MESKYILIKGRGPLLITGTHVVNTIRRKNEIHNNESYICAYHPKKFDKDKLNETSKKLIQHLQSGSVNMSDLIKQSTYWKLAKTDCLKEIKWLVKSGILRQYESGKIELT